jgi:Tfp pilus assembly protein PilP
MNGWRWLVWMSTVGATAFGCGGGPPAPSAASKVALETKPATAAAQTPALPTVKPKIPEPGPPLTPLTYQPKGRRDPFTPVEVRKDKPGLDVAALKLVGTISGRHLLALVETPGGVGYILKPGDGLGNGQVTAISAESVTFAVSGQRSQRETSVTLRLARD